ncbi:MAG: glycosyltransferase family 2 protein [bacterium]|nr:glycosyltransferase family 2 protein [bacterium]
MRILSIIIPVFNEEQTIESILRRVEQINLDNIRKEVIVVDDGSADKTRTLLKGWESKFTVLYHERNQGKGSAIKTALSLAHGDYTIIQDADLEYDPKDWPQLLRAIEEEKVAAVYGSRNLGPAKRGYFFFYWGGRLLTRLMNFWFRSQLTDINTGYKLFRTDILKSLNLQSRGFEFCEEVTAKLLKRKYAIKEIPIGYSPRTFTEGKKITSWDGLVGIWTILKNII